MLEGRRPASYCSGVNDPTAMAGRLSFRLATGKVSAWESKPTKGRDRTAEKLNGKFERIFDQLTLRAALTVPDQTQNRRYAFLTHILDVSDIAKLNLLLAYSKLKPVEKTPRTAQPEPPFGRRNHLPAIHTEEIAREIRKLMECHLCSP